PLPLSVVRLYAPATTEIYTLSLHDALPIFAGADAQDRGRGDRGAPRAAARRRGAAAAGAAARARSGDARAAGVALGAGGGGRAVDRKSTRLNSSHVKISYAVFCLKKKKL